MKQVILITLLALTLSNSIINRKFVSHLKKIAPFQVYEVEENPFKDYTLEELRNLAGTKDDPSVVRKTFKNIVINDEYDFRKEYPQCILGIRDQGHCGGCYAFGTATCHQYRWCMKTNGEMDKVLSPQHIVSCDMEELGCRGGFSNKAFEFIYHDGLVTEECFPYSSTEGGIPEFCITECKNGEKWAPYYSDWTDSFEYAKDIMDDMPINGPIETHFDVYDDFYDYKGGIYQVTSEDPL